MKTLPNKVTKKTQRKKFGNKIIQIPSSFKEC